MNPEIFAAVCAVEVPEVDVELASMATYTTGDGLKDPDDR